MLAAHAVVLTLGCLVADVPVSSDPAISIELFSENPMLVTPTGIAVDNRGRVFVAESHTHFRPDDYKGPPTDRILILEDTDGDHRADRRTLFHEGFTHIMDIAFHADGSLFVATRMDIHRMRDTTGDGKADQIVPVIKMETTGTYPHNGISGLCFNADGSLNFGLGENLGHEYTLVGTDGMRLSGGGEGGTTYHAAANGTGLRRVTTGWWNPFGMCVDADGRIFGTDNDPGASPPCRLLQIHEGADYGYEYRYGRTGLHPLITWTGDLPGTIPMIAGTGEAPCHIIACEGTSLPPKYRGNLLVAAWADHYIERYDITQPFSSGQTQAERHTLITGPNDFRPVGLAVAPDGSIYVSDWVSASYQLHGLGRIWRVRGSTPVPANDGPHARDEPTLRELTTTARSHDRIAERVRAVTELLEHGGSPREWAGSEQPTAVRAVAVPRLSVAADLGPILDATESDDPLLRHAAIQSMSRQTLTPQVAELTRSPSAPVLLALKRSEHRGRHARSHVLDTALDRHDDEVWGVAVKWIADDMLTERRPQLVAELDRPSLTVDQFLMLTAAIDRLDGKEPRDVPAPARLTAIAKDKNRSTGLRVAALRLLQPTSGQLTTPAVIELTEHENPLIREEAIRLLTGREEARALVVLLRKARDETGRLSERLQAIAALAPVCNSIRHRLVTLAADESDAVAQAALQSLTGATLTAEDRDALAEIRATKPARSEAVDRVAGTPLSRPAATDTSAWLRLLDGPADRGAGERIYFHTGIGTCSRCHQHDGRGIAVGPSLSLIERRLPADRTEARRWLLETILQPGRDMAPQYTTWTIVTRDGKQLTGLPRRKGSNQEAYLGLDGKEFTVKKSDIEYHRESRTSLMPEGLLQNLTRQELRDLFAFLLDGR